MIGVWVYSRRPFYFRTACVVFFNDHVLKYSGKSLSRWSLCSCRHDDLLGLCSAPTASAHYPVFSAHARLSTHFHVAERLLMRRALLLPHCFLFSEHISEENEPSRWPAGSNLLQNPRVRLKCRFSWRLRSWAEHHSNKREVNSTFTLTLHYTALICVQLHLVHKPFIPIVQLRSHLSLWLGVGVMPNLRSRV